MGVSPEGEAAFEEEKSCQGELMAGEGSGDMERGAPGGQREAISKQGQPNLPLREGTVVPSNVVPS